MRPRHSPVWFDDDADFARFGDVLARCEFRDDAINRLLGTTGGVQAQSKGAGLLHTRTEGSSLGTLVRLLLIGSSVPASDLAAAIAPMSVHAWHRAGIIELQADTARAAVQLLPLSGGLLLASDRARHAQGAGDLPVDHVMSVARSTLMLADATVRAPSRTTLDLGAGSGYQAIMAAPHSQTVLATDRNPRAIGFARFNARINGLNNLSAEVGDLLAPAAGKVFDLIITNPPFVITPGQEFIYRDGGMAGDSLVESICRAAPAHLHNNGFCQMICNWAHLKGQDWRARLREWFVRSGCDVWVMRSETLDAAAYASFWIRHTVGPEADRPGGLFDQWMREYERLGIEAVSMGMIFMRRHDAPGNWLRIDDEPGRIAGPFGHHVQRAFANADFLATAQRDDDLLDARLRLAPDATALTELEIGERREWRPRETTLRLSSGLCYEGSADGHILKLLAECDGTRPLRDPLARMCRALMRDPGELIPPALGIVRTLLERGLLLAPSRT